MKEYNIDEALARAIHDAKLNDDYEREYRICGIYPRDADRLIQKHSFEYDYTSSDGMREDNRSYYIRFNLVLKLTWNGWTGDITISGRKSCNYWLPQKH